MCNYSLYENYDFVDYERALKTHKSVENLLLKYENEIINPITIHESLKRKPDIDYCFPLVKKLYQLITTCHPGLGY